MAHMGDATQTANVIPFPVERRRTFTAAELRMINIFRRGNPDLTCERFAHYENGDPLERYLYDLFRRAVPPRG